MPKKKRSFEGANHERARELLRQAREQTPLTKKQVAAKALVGYSNYLAFENGTRIPAREEIPRIEAVLISHGARLKAKELVLAWFRLPPEGRFEDVFTFRAGFRKVNVPDAAEPEIVLWFHKLRAPHLVHGVFTLAASAALASGRRVRLLLDDLGQAPRSSTRKKFEDAVAYWLARAGVEPGALEIDTYRQITSDLRSDGLPEELLNRYFASKVTAADYLRAAKVATVTGLPDGGEILVVEQKHSMANLLVTPLWNSIVLDRQLAELGEADGSDPFVITLGGADEAPLWSFWRETAEDAHSNAVGHFFLEKMPVNPWERRELYWDGGYTEKSIRESIERLAPVDGFIEWMWRTTVVLPALAGISMPEIDPSLNSLEGVSTAAAEDLPLVARMLTTALLAWFPPQ